MESFNLKLITAVGVIVFAIHKLIVYPAFFSPLSKDPAAYPTAHVLPLWIYYIRWRNMENKTVYQLHKVLRSSLHIA